MPLLSPEPFNTLTSVKRDMLICNSIQVYPINSINTYSLGCFHLYNLFIAKYSNIMHLLHISPICSKFIIGIVTLVSFIIVCFVINNITRLFNFIFEKLVPFIKNILNSLSSNKDQSVQGISNTDSSSSSNNNSDHIHNNSGNDGNANNNNVGNNSDGDGGSDGNGGNNNPDNNTYNFPVFTPYGRSLYLAIQFILRIVYKLRDALRNHRRGYADYVLDSFAFRASEFIIAMMVIAAIPWMEEFTSLTIYFPFLNEIIDIASHVQDNNYEQMEFLLGDIEARGISNIATVNYRHESALDFIAPFVDMSDEVLLNLQNNLTALLML